MYFLYHPTTRPTGRPLAMALQANYGVRIRTRRTPTKILIRWGSQRFPGLDVPLMLNTPDALRKASNKLRAFEIWGEAEVNHVPVTRSRQDAAQWLTDGVTVLSRVDGLSRGRGIVPNTPGGTLYEAAFYTKFIPNRREYRLHVVGDQVVRTQRKYFAEGVVPENPYVKNVGEGYVFKAPARELHNSRKTLAIKAVTSLGLDFGAVDMIIDGTGVAWVLEVNSAPACSPMTAAAYVSGLCRLISERTEGMVQLNPALEHLNALSND